MNGFVAQLLFLSCLSGVQVQSSGLSVNDITEQGHREGRGTEIQIEGRRTASILTDNQTTPELDVPAELKELRDMMVEQRVEQRNMEARLKTSESQTVDLKVELSVTKTELQFTKNQMEELKTENKGLAKELSYMGARVTISDSEMEGLKRENAAQEAELIAMGARVTASESKNGALEVRLSASESQVEELKRENTGRPKVAFSASLMTDNDSGYIGPLSADTTLAYNNVFTNIGKAYNPATGTFSAPVSGSYYFRFTACGSMVSEILGVYLYKNEQRIMYTYEHDTDSEYEYLSNAVVLQLEEGDVVYMRLPANLRLYDDANNRNTFSGFLLFTI